jgi:division protein CdvB (Snf7/Vps24/ESCRT-III family)
MQRQEQQFRHDMDRARNALSEEFHKLVPIGTRLNTVEKQLQEQIVVDVFRGDKTHANMLANELVVIRKVSNMVADLKVIFETFIVRIGTIKDYSEFYDAMSSTATELREVKHDLAQITPTAKAVLADVSDTLSTISTLDIKQQPSIAVVTDDALEILEEASTVVEERLKHKFPTLPEIKPEKEKRVLVNV